jgi:hypothetical protein
LLFDQNYYFNDNFDRKVEVVYVANFGLDRCDTMETAGTAHPAIVAALVGAMGMENQLAGSTGAN